MAINHNGYGGGSYTSSWGYCSRCNEQTTRCVPGNSNWLCQNCSEFLRKCNVLGYQSTSIDAQLAGAEQRVRDLLAKKEAMAKFGSDEDYGEDDAILFKRRYDGKKIYTYVAVKTPVGWYITGITASCRMTFTKLVEDYLLEATEVWVCAEWRQVC